MCGQRARAGDEHALPQTHTFQVSTCVALHSHADIRDTDGARRDTIVAKVVAAAAEIAQRRKVRHSVSIVNQDPPAQCSDAVQAAAKRASDSLGLKSMSMVSRAYHDSLFMAR
jgi:ureidoglycolate amidohydrolase